MGNSDGQKWKGDRIRLVPFRKRRRFRLSSWTFLAPAISLSPSLVSTKQSSPPLILLLPAPAKPARPELRCNVAHLAFAKHSIRLTRSVYAGPLLADLPPRRTGTTGTGNLIALLLLQPCLLPLLLIPTPPILTHTIPHDVSPRKISTCRWQT